MPQNRSVKRCTGATAPGGDHAEVVIFIGEDFHLVEFRSEDPDGQQRLGANSSRPGHGQKELLRLGLALECLTDGRHVLDCGNLEAVERKSVPLAFMVS